MTTPDPKDLRALLPLYVGGEVDPPDLDPEEAARVRAALPRHPALAAELAAFEAARGALLAERDAAPARVDLWPGVRAALRDEGLLGVPARPRPRDFEVPSPPARAAGAPRLRLLAGSGLAAAAALVAFVALRGTGPGVEPEDGSPGAPGAVERFEPFSGPAGFARSTPPEPPAATPAGLRPVLQGDASLDDLRAPRRGQPVWIVAPGRGGTSELAGYR